MPYRALLAGLLLTLGSCVQRPPPVAETPRFFVGNPFLSQGKWEYPRNFTSYHATGLAVVLDAPAGSLTADHEAYDPSALTAASAVLQLPAIVTLTDLVTGRSLQVRVNDRLVDQPGRLIGVTPKVAELLGFPGDGVVEVEVVLDVQKTGALDGALGAGPHMTAAPVARIEAQPLAEPGQISPAGPARELGAQQQAPAADEVALSGTVTLVPPAPGPLYVQIPGFGHQRDAERTMDQLFGFPATVTPVFGGERTLWAIRVGPYRSVAAADAAFQAILQRGVADPEIIVR